MTIDQDCLLFRVWSDLSQDCWRQVKNLSFQLLFTQFNKLRFDANWLEFIIQKLRHLENVFPPWRISAYTGPRYCYQQNQRNFTRGLPWYGNCVCEPLNEVICVFVNKFEEVPWGWHIMGRSSNRNESALYWIRHVARAPTWTSVDTYQVCGYFADIDSYS